MTNFKNSLTIAASITTISLLAGCAQTVNRVQPSAESAYRTQTAIQRQVSLGKFTMPETRDRKSILCDQQGDLQLPDNLTYSTYIEDAFAKTLSKANRYSPTIERGVHELSAHINTAEYNSTSGVWIINGNVRVDYNKPVRINTKTSYDIAGQAYSSCKTVAIGFETATANFVNQSLTNPRIVAELNR